MRGYGPFLSSILDRDKWNNFLHQSESGNPKYLFRSDFLSRLKNISSNKLDMVKEWNKLLKM